jgi:cell division topological specificity factor
MRIFDFFRTKSGATSAAGSAKERLQIVVAHDRVGTGRPDILPNLQRELMKVIAKYCDIDEKLLTINVERNGTSATLEINVELPNDRIMAAAANH